MLVEFDMFRERRRLSSVIAPIHAFVQPCLQFIYQKTSFLKIPEGAYPNVGFTTMTESPEATKFDGRDCAFSYRIQELSAGPTEIECQCALLADEEELLTEPRSFNTCLIFVFDEDINHLNQPMWNGLASAEVLKVRLDLREVLREWRVAPAPEPEFNYRMRTRSSFFSSKSKT